MKVSVIITNYNHGDTVLRAINSVLNQSFKSFEVIVVDDGSTDGSRDTLLDAKFDWPVKVYFIPHSGLTETFIFALGRCTGDYVAFCDSDDYWTNPFKLSAQVELIEKENAGAVCSLATEGETYIAAIAPGDVSFNGLLRGDTVPCPTIMFRRDLIDPEMIAPYFVQDYPILLEIAAKSKIVKLPYFTAHYTRAFESYSHTHSRKRRLHHILQTYKIRLHFIKKYGCTPGTVFYLTYRLFRDISAIILKRW